MHNNHHFQIVQIQTVYWFSHVDDGFNVGLEPTLSDFHHFGDDDDDKNNRKKLTDQDYYDEDGNKKRKKKRKRKLVHKIITRKMVKDEEYRKQVDEKIYKELAVPTVQEYTGPQYDVRLVNLKVGICDK